MLISSFFFLNHFCLQLLDIKHASYIWRYHFGITFSSFHYFFFPGKLYFCECDVPIVNVIMESRSDKLEKACMVDLRYEHFPISASDAAKDDIYEGFCYCLSE